MPSQAILYVYIPCRNGQWALVRSIQSFKSNLWKLHRISYCHLGLTAYMRPRLHIPRPFSPLCCSQHWLTFMRYRALSSQLTLMLMFFLASPGRTAAVFILFLARVRARTIVCSLLVHIYRVPVCVCVCECSIAVMLRLANRACAHSRYMCAKCFYQFTSYFNVNCDRN